MKNIFFLFAIATSFTIKGQVQKQNLPDKIVFLTFDDAVVSQYNFVAPLLKKHGFGATFYICEFPPNFGDTTKYMDWQMIKKLDDMGFEIANHTRTHPAVAKLSKEELLKELNYIEDKCEELGINKPETFAYPGYSLSQSVMDVLSEKGYLFARAGGSRVYKPESDYPLLVPSWAMNAENKTQIMEALKQAGEGKIVVLTIHGVPDIEHPWVNTPPELFEQYVNYLAENDFTVVALRDLGKYIDVENAMKKLIADLTKPLKN
ncbi:polysaccharide deacetylase family protein [Maribellus maritimus]|uniref:polysaccharide deacetylase family protein n=1 Tax=Maribellus maritimus TaxID=2870838 RepID=UPI001EECD21F|nr:polysaccharide deacetylase family protein [Maribellus maritimus]MCG6188456.1 polysaccharide deacetylase family protein [Maribellus maritimus]